MFVKFEGKISKIVAAANFLVHHVAARIHARCVRVTPQKHVFSIGVHDCKGTAQSILIIFISNLRAFHAILCKLKKNFQ